MGAPVFDGSQHGPPLGYFTYAVANDQWSWSGGMYALHGFATGEVPASTEVLLHHKHPDDRARTFEVLETALVDGQPFSCYHRIIDRHSKVRSVLSVGRGVRDTEGNVKELVGYFIDLTEVRRSETEAGVEIAMARIAEHRAVIDQAKGMLMLVNGCDADEAFGILRRCSANANIKLHDVAHRLVDAVGPQFHGSDDPRTAINTFLEGLKPVSESRSDALTSA